MCVGEIIVFSIELISKQATDDDDDDKQQKRQLSPIKKS